MLNIYFVCSFLIILTRTVAGASCPRIVTRQEWSSSITSGPSETSNPALYVIAHHTETPECTTRRECERILRSLQTKHEIYGNRIIVGYNFMIGNDGNVYEGMGWDRKTRNTSPNGEDSIRIALIGNYTSVAPKPEMLSVMERLIECGISQGAILQSNKRYYW